MKHLFIVNPIAGGGRALRLIPEIRRIFEERTDEYRIEITKLAGEATAIARRHVAREKLRVYAVGGDGTLNEVLNGVAGSESSLGIIPAGSGNDFVKCLGLDSRGVNLVRAIIEGREESIDIGKLNDQYFINIASVGFDAQVAFNSNRLKRIPFLKGKLIYMMGILVTLLRYRNNQLNLGVDQQRIQTKFLLLSVANGRYYGGGILPAPEAKINDGYLDVCLINAKNIFQIIRFLPKFVQGRHGQLKGVSFYKGRRIEINCDRELKVNMDGEIGQCQTMTLEVIPRGIQLIVPHTGNPG